MDSTEAGLELIKDNRGWCVHLGNDVERLKNNELTEHINLSRFSDLKKHMELVTHRMQWLELVIKGLNYQEQQNAALYARFIDKKTNLEEMDIHDLRNLLR